MILLWGIPEDSPLQLVAKALERCHAKVLWLNQHECMNWRLELRVSGRVSGILETLRRRIAFEEVKAAYLRPYDLRQLYPFDCLATHDPKLLRATQLGDALLSWSDMTPAKVVNRPAAMASNGSKPFQSLQIEACGFAVPRTLITTDAEAAREFWSRHGKVIYKSTSSVRSIVRRLSAQHRARWKDLQWCPTQFQEYIEGTDHRVHVVGDRTFASRIVSDADDYRYACWEGRKTKVTSAQLPPELTDRCIRLAHSIGLPVAGLDLRKTPDGRWYCFEVNPSPGFSYYEEATGQPIAKAVAAYLVRATSGAPAF